MTTLDQQYEIKNLASCWTKKWEDVINRWLPLRPVAAMGVAVAIATMTNPALIQTTTHPTRVTSKAPRNDLLNNAITPPNQRINGMMPVYGTNAWFGLFNKGMSIRITVVKYAAQLTHEYLGISGIATARCQPRENLSILVRCRRRFSFLRRNNRCAFLTARLTLHSSTCRS
jgi:hypothetical protein